MAVLILVVGSSRKSRSLSISLIFVVTFLLSPSWAAALPKNLHSSISLLSKQQHMSFSRAGQQDLHFLHAWTTLGQQPAASPSTLHAWTALGQHLLHLGSMPGSTCKGQQLLDSYLQHLLHLDTTPGNSCWTALQPSQTSSSPKTKAATDPFLLSIPGSTREVPSKLCWQQCFGAQKHQHFTSFSL
jgi:hypothetical protein